MYGQDKEATVVGAIPHEHLSRYPTYGAGTALAETVVDRGSLGCPTLPRQCVICSAEGIAVRASTDQTYTEVYDTYACCLQQRGRSSPGPDGPEKGSVSEP